MGPGRHPRHNLSRRVKLSKRTVVFLSIGLLVVTATLISSASALGILFSAKELEVECHDFSNIMCLAVFFISSSLKFSFNENFTAF